jgi:hypothetical protein
MVSAPKYLAVGTALAICYKIGPAYAKTLSNMYVSHKCYKNYIAWFVALPWHVKYK